MSWATHTRMSWVGECPHAILNRLWWWFWGLSMTNLNSWGSLFLFSSGLQSLTTNQHTFKKWDISPPRLTSSKANFPSSVFLLICVTVTLQEKEWPEQTVDIITKGAQKESGVRQGEFKQSHDLQFSTCIVGGDILPRQSLSSPAQSVYLSFHDSPKQI
jgi:hypothetical protein